MDAKLIQQIAELINNSQSFALGIAFGAGLVTLVGFVALVKELTTSHAWKQVVRRTVLTSLGGLALNYAIKTDEAQRIRIAAGIVAAAKSGTEIVAVANNNKVLLELAGPAGGINGIEICQITPTNVIILNTCFKEAGIQWQVRNGPAGARP